MVTIRFARGGSKHRPFFNVVVTDSHRRRDGNFIERVGFYNPTAPEGTESLRINKERLVFWGGRMIAPALLPGRKVRTPQGATVPNGNSGQPGDSATENTPPMERTAVHRQG